MRKLGIGAALALVGVVALVAGGIAVATGDDDAPDKRADEHLSLPPPPPVFFHDRGERRDQFAKELAAELDIDVEKVKDALRAVFKKHLDQAVEDELLTQKEADRILECHEDGEKCRPPGFRAFRGRPGFRGERGLRGRFERGLRGRFERGPGGLPGPPHVLPAPPPPRM